MILDATHADPIFEIRRWFETFGGYVAAVDFESARPMFAEDAVGFGTYQDVIVGREAIEQGQWRNVWPTISEFRFDLDGLRGRVSEDGTLAFAVVTWSSIGTDAHGRSFDRPGRATLTFARRARSDPWRAVHSHFSLNRGVPQQSFGQSAPT